MLRFNLQAPLNRTGVGTHGQYLVSRLAMLEQVDKNFEFSVQVLHDHVDHSISHSVRDQITKKLMTQKEVQDSADLDIFLGTADGGGYKSFRGNKKIAYIVLETDALSRQQAEFLSGFNEYWTPNDSHGQVLEDHDGCITVRVVPEGASQFDVTIDDPLPEDGVLCLLSIGKFEKRKGHEVLLDSLEIVGEHTPVRLLAHWDNPWNPKGSIQALKQRGYHLNAGTYQKGDIRVKPMSPVTWQVDLVSSMRASHLAVFPHFGEGWGLAQLECIVNGLPTIGSAHTGSEDYMSAYDICFSSACSEITGQSLPEESYVCLRQPAERELAEDGIFYHGDKGYWYPVDPRHVANMILSKSWDRIWPSQRVEIADHMAEQYSWLKSAEKFIEACKEAVGS